MPIARPGLQIAKPANRRLAAIGLICASVVASAAASAINAEPAGQPGPALLAWTASIGLLLAGGWGRW